MWFFTFAFSVFMLCAFWLGTVFSSLFFATIYKYEKTTSTTSSTCSWSSRNFEPRKHTRNGAAFLAKDSRKWLSYVCRSRFHTLSLSFTLSRHDALSLLTAFLNTRSNCALSVFFFFYYFVWYLLALLQSTLAQTLFCLIVYVLWDPFFGLCLPLAVWESRLSNHLLQNLQF